MHWFSNDISLMCHCFLGAGVLAADRGAGLHRGVSVAGGGTGPSSDVALSRLCSNAGESCDSEGRTHSVGLWHRTCRLLSQRTPGAWRTWGIPVIAKRSIRDVAAGPAPCPAPGDQHLRALRSHQAQLWPRHLKGQCHNLLKCLEMRAPRFGLPLPPLVTHQQ